VGPIDLGPDWLWEKFFPAMVIIGLLASAGVLGFAVVYIIHHLAWVQ
jgi:hypothetical protein